MRATLLVIALLAAGSSQIRALRKDSRDRRLSRVVTSLPSGSGAAAPRVCSDIIWTPTSPNLANGTKWHKTSWSGGTDPIFYDGGIDAGPGAAGAVCLDGRNGLAAAPCGEATTSTEWSWNGSFTQGGGVGSLFYHDAFVGRNGQTLRFSFWARGGLTVPPDAGNDYVNFGSGPSFAAPCILSQTRTDWTYCWADLFINASDPGFWMGQYGASGGSLQYSGDGVRFDITEINVRVADGGSGITQSCTDLTP